MPSRQSRVGRLNEVTDSVTTRFRAVEDSDRDFLLAVYASTRADEMAIVPWTDQEKKDFVRLQFESKEEFGYLP